MQAPGDPGELGGFWRAGERPTERHDVLRPEHEIDGRANRHGRSQRGGVNDRCRHLLIGKAPPSSTLHDSDM